LTVHELREQLARLPDEWLVVLARDREGNGFSPLDGVGAGEYVQQSTWAGDFIRQPLRARTIGAREAVCLWPVN
jgi:hypothetical protein